MTPFPTSHTQSSSDDSGHIDPDLIAAFEELRLRAEKEKCSAQEKEYLYNSLRFSERLRSLEESPTSHRRKRDAQHLRRQVESSFKRLSNRIFFRFAPRNLQRTHRKTSLQSLTSESLSVHTTITTLDEESQIEDGPVMKSIVELCKNVAETLENTKNPSTPDAFELLQLLHLPQIVSLLDTCEQIASQSPRWKTSVLEVPGVQDTPTPVFANCVRCSDGISLIKLVSVTSENIGQPLGAVIVESADKAGIHVSHVLKDSVLGRSGFVCEGDELLSVDGTSVVGCSVDQVADSFSRSHTHSCVKLILLASYRCNFVSPSLIDNNRFNRTLSLPEASDAMKVELDVAMESAPRVSVLCVETSV